MSKTTNSEQHGHRTIGTAVELGLDSTGGKWAVVCEDHHTVLSVATQKAARSSATAEFCDGCREKPSEAPLTADESEFATLATKDWRGNYNTVFAPGAEAIAAAAGVPVQTVVVSTMLRQTAIAGDEAEQFRIMLDEFEGQALAAMKTWQKTLDRKDATDMEKFNQNRSFLSGYLGAVAQGLTGSKKRPVVSFAKDMDHALRSDALKAGAAARKASA